MHKNKLFSHKKAYDRGMATIWQRVVIQNKNSFGSSYKIMAIKPPEPSLMILSNVSFNLYLAFSGINEIFAWIPSLTIELNERPKISEFQMDRGSSSKSCIKYLTSSSLCFSVPMIGANSDSTSTLII